jgi:multidrug efflux pump subunit AcrA (membrane-fusion protein)
VLREPHLKRLEAELASARSALARARRDVERTVITAPFNAVVLAEHVERGQSVGPQSAIATLVGTDACWVRVNVPTWQLKYVALPDAEGAGGARATIVHDRGAGERTRREGSVVRLLGDLETRGMMARLLVEVADPFCLGREAKQTLLLGSFVSVEIEGAQMKDVISVPRSVVREGDKAWILDRDGRLEIRPLDVIWRDDRALVVKGLSAGEKVISSHIPSPVENMSLTEAR